VIEQGATLHKTGDRLIVEKEGKELLEVECHRIDSVLLFGNIQITTQAMKELLEHGIEFALLSFHGKLLGQLTPPRPRNVLLRMAQYRIYHNDQGRLQLAKTIVSGKLENALAVLRRHRYETSRVRRRPRGVRDDKVHQQVVDLLRVLAQAVRTAGEDHQRSEERRVGKECRSRWSPYH